MDIFVSAIGNSEKLWKFWDTTTTNVVKWR